MSQQQRKRKSVQDTFQPNKRVVLTHAQKRQLCLDSQKTPRPTQEELAVLYKVKQNTVSDILKKKEKWLLVNPDSEDANKQKERPVYFPQVEEALSLWVTNALAAELTINTDILREKAKYFAQQFEINKFSFSNGWIDKFKRRHNLKEYIKWGEAKSAPLETLDEERGILREIIKDYDLNDVFNCDETGLYWDLEPSKTLAQGPLSGTKKSKKRVTLLLTCNATGTEKLKPLFIHKYQNPRALNGKKKKNYRQIRLQNRNILLLVDNAPVHIINEDVNLTNVVVHFLPPNTTSHLQPCDAGIINSFKAQYRKLLVRNRIEAYEISQELNKEPTTINIHDSIDFSVNAWNSVSQQTIINCWKHTGILPINEMDEIDEIEDQALHDEMELQDLINELPFDNLMDADEFLHIDDCLKSNEGLTDDEIVSMIKSNNNNESEMDPDEEPPVVIPETKALGYLDDLVLFFKHSSDVCINPNELSVLQKLRHQVLKLHVNNSKQTTLDNFVQIL
ncbi:CENP-B homolog protein 2-like [Rhizophagus irregularis DAOM 181602=DAOM 197198]|nr:CENP-B homolog protein 2-like [Rhizophagus irregularis DAOM 181602=DAOM 197198]